MMAPIVIHEAVPRSDSDSVFALLKTIADPVTHKARLDELTKLSADAFSAQTAAQADRDQAVAARDDATKAQAAATAAQGDLAHATDAFEAMRAQRNEKLDAWEHELSAREGKLVADRQAAADAASAAADVLAKREAALGAATSANDMRERKLDLRDRATADAFAAAEAARNDAEALRVDLQGRLEKMKALAG